MTTVMFTSTHHPPLRRLLSTPRTVYSLKPKLGHDPSVQIGVTPNPDPHPHSGRSVNYSRTPSDKFSKTSRSISYFTLTRKLSILPILQLSSTTR